jgi:hypothetical protein
LIVVLFDFYFGSGFFFGPEGFAHSALVVFYDAVRGVEYRFC